MANEANGTETTTDAGTAGAGGMLGAEVAEGDKGTGAGTAGDAGTQTDGDKAKAEAAAKAAADAKTKADADAAAAKADLELKLPKGFDPKDELLGKFKATAKELGLDSPKAQKLFDLYAGAQQAAAEKAGKELDERLAGWTKASKEDKEFGGKEFDANLQVARKAMQKFGSPELRKFFRETGLGDHPEVMRAFVKVGKAIAEDSIAGGSNAGNGAKDPQAFEKAMYPTMFEKQE